MKKSIKFILLVGMTYGFWACSNEDVVIRYPKSTPSIDTVKVAESVITYGDSIHLQVGVSDKVTPLSTLTVKVVTNNEVVKSEVIRTKGNHASIKRTYGVPFVANRPDNSPVKIYLTSTNVSGTQKDSIVSSTIAKRPPITDLYLVPDFGSGATIKLELANPDSLIYKATDLLYSTSFNYKLATKIDKFKRIDWSGMVFGKVGDGIGLIDQTGESINATDATLVGISKFTFDAVKFTAKVGGKLLEPVTTLDVIADLPLNPPTLIYNTDFRGNNVYFGENVEVQFSGSGITNDLANNISPDYFEVTGTNKAKFLGKTGLYKAYYLTTANYLYIEPQPELLYPDALWVCGQGLGRPSKPYTTTSSWNWNSPLDYIPARLVSPGIYQITVYVQNTPGTDKWGTLNFKFFHKRGWWDGHEEWSTFYTVSPPFYATGDEGVVGNVVTLSTDIFDGVYRITLNQNDHTITSVKLN
ncbi:MAG TPA: DUF5016 domain-containing protein [Prolixibacteraceae bacterium]|jgi:hypothetical protein